jgi:flagellar hook-associated protein 2
VGTISSGVGLISGLDYTSLIEQLIEIESGPRDRLLERITAIDAQRTAYLDISARISALMTQVHLLAKRSFFLSNTVSSSNTDVLNVTADSDAVPGSYSFIVRSLATTHQLVSRGYASSDAQLAAGQISIESAAAQVNAETKLDELNGYDGVQRGSFQLIDGNGDCATVNLSDAVTLADAVDRINAAGVNVRAEVHGDGLLLTETNGGTLRVRELNGGHTAADLGFGPGHSYDTGGRIEGNSLVYLADWTPLSALNDSNGVRHARAGGDFTVNGITVELGEVLKVDTRIERLNRGQGVDLGSIRITTEDGAGVEHAAEVDLRGLGTVGEIKNAIEGAVEGVSVTLVDNQLRVSYSDGNTTKYLKIEDITGHAARGLGIDGESEYGKISGDEILKVDTAGAVIAAINYATGNDGSVAAAIDGTRLVIDGGASLELAALNGSQALYDLGFSEGTQEGAVSGRRVIGGIDSVLLSTLNGGSGFEGGRINIQVGGDSVTIDLTGTETLQQVIDRISQAADAEGLGIEVGCDHTGTRLVFESIDGVSAISISDVPGYGTFAVDTGLAQTEPTVRLCSDNLQRRYISEAMPLEDLNNGGGVTLGTIRLTNSRGLSATVDLTTGTVETLQDVIDRINNARISSGESLGVIARVNGTGDGLLVEDTAGGELDLQIEDVTGTTASDLNLLGASQGGVIDGSYEINIELSGHETLEDVVDMINQRGGLATASILNDGTEISPYRLQISSAVSGSAGALIVDGLDFTTLSAAQDAQVVLGTNPDSGVLLTSSTNTLTDIVPGLTIDLAGVSDEPVTVTISRDTDSVVEAFQSFVSGFNAAADRIDELSSYDAKTETRGVLLGEGTLQTVEQRLWRMVIQRLDGATGDLQRLADLGIRLQDGDLQFDEEKLLTALENDLEEVIEFFTDAETGMAATMKEQLETITETGGLIDRRESTLETQREQMADRVDVLNDRLNRRAEQLMREFLAMESALAQLQSQQSALTQLAALTESG